PGPLTCPSAGVMLRPNLGWHWGDPVPGARSPQMMRPRGIWRRGAIIAAALFLIGAIITILTGQARAAVPNRWGFAFVDKPTVAGVTDPNHQAGSWPAAFQVKSSPGVVGQVLVRF